MCQGGAPWGVREARDAKTESGRGCDVCDVYVCAACMCDACGLWCGRACGRTVVLWGIEIWFCVPRSM